MFSLQVLKNPVRCAWSSLAFSKSMESNEGIKFIPVGLTVTAYELWYKMLIYMDRLLHN